MKECREGAYHVANATTEVANSIMAYGILQLEHNRISHIAFERQPFAYEAVWFKLLA